MKSHLKLPSNIPHKIGKTLVKPCLLKTIKLLPGEASEANMRRISLPAIPFKAHFRYARRCERPGGKSDESISNNSNVFFQVDESTKGTCPVACFHEIYAVHSGDIKRRVPVL